MCTYTRAHSSAGARAYTLYKHTRMYAEYYCVERTFALSAKGVVGSKRVFFKSTTSVYPYPFLRFPFTTNDFPKRRHVTLRSCACVRRVLVRIPVSVPPPPTLSSSSPRREDDRLSTGPRRRLFKTPSTIMTNALRLYTENDIIRARV